ncbi:MAG: FG-GAP-like repeat-containing protein [candidate division KSB1 bacterium]|nr:FG-GAP-like repeat-containing protein [candidate division KSB1 bacterium]MDZ7367946.1 FG-GAP-like repeat-containing protein [candidate division KSB1 bacterium]MDZ7405569.1 FG-GAP-like repeat-containing protein [candidate division KSB1 bacterium]
MQKSIRLIAIFLFIFLLSACEKQQVDDKRQITAMISARTLGLAYLEENKLSEAEAEFLKLIQLAPKEALGYANLGLVYMRRDDFAKAEQQIKEAIKLDPDDPEIRLIAAKIYELTNREDEAIRELENSLKKSPDHVKSLHNLAELCLKRDDDAARRRGEECLNKAVELKPANLVARLQLIETLLRNGKADAAAARMEELIKQVPELPKDPAEFYDKALALMRAGKANEALTPAIIFHNLLKLTPLYQAGVLELKGPGGALIGFPVMTFSQQISTQPQSRQAVLAAIRFTDATAVAGLNIVPKSARQPDPAAEFGASVAVGDYDGDGDQDLYVASRSPHSPASAHFLFRNDFGEFIETSSAAGIKHQAKETAAIFADYDNDGRLDLYIVNDGPNVLYRNLGDGRFQEVTATAGVGDADYGCAARFVDLDLDGDLDLFLANAGVNRVYRNNGDGAFGEMGEKMGLAGTRAKTRDAVFGDFDDDGDIDLFVVNENASNILYTNLRQGRFQDTTAASGVTSKGKSGAAAAGDYNNDGYVDLFVTSLDGGDYFLYRNKGDGTFEKDRHASTMLKALKNLAGLDAEFFDFDNDGFLDLLVAGAPLAKTGRGVFLFHNDGTGKFKEVSSLLPAEVLTARRIALADYNEDGDLDIFLAGLDGGVRLLRNDGGNANHYLKMQLVGLRTGSGKNNYFGIGAKVEIRAGEHYQMRVVTEPAIHFGLGERLKADVVRILWPNGTPQNLFYPGSDQDLVEQQTLKGSCAFLYTWNGRRYTFVKDIMWRSALGMPLGIMGGETAYAFPHASQEYLKIPGDSLQIQDGKIILHITEELWETAYFDQVKLFAVDHPDSVEIYVDERFVPPPFPPLHIYQVAQKRLPKSARDEQGNDLLPALRAQDDVYASNLKPAKFQGLTELHDLILDLGDFADSDSVVLFLNGWLFPSDASINVAIAQSGQPKVIPPYLQVRNRRGEWQTVIENMSFPMGKDKMVVADLTGKFLTRDHRVRIRTNMEIYWDYVFSSVNSAKKISSRKAVPAGSLVNDTHRAEFTQDSSGMTLRQTLLPLLAADLHYRGFSRLYRRGGRYGPHWFDYNEVSKAPKWRDLVGNYTRYGDVLPLLSEPDDKYIIMNAGDEVTITFDATKLPELPNGWKRDYLIYSDGWIKDGDLNTAHGQTVEPLPFHAMTSYPYGPEQAYPGDEEHQRYLKTYNTRKVTTEKFRRLLSNPR